MTAITTTITREDRRVAKRFAALMLLPDATVPGVQSEIRELATDDMPMRYARKNLAMSATMFRDIAAQTPKQAQRRYRVYVQEAMAAHPDEVRCATYQRLRRVWQSYRALGVRPDSATWLVAVCEAGVAAHATWYCRQPEFAETMRQAENARASGALS
jgi:hypothetical protein